MHFATSCELAVLQVCRWDERSELLERMVDEATILYDTCCSSKADLPDTGGTHVAALIAHLSHYLNFFLNVEFVRCATLPRLLHDFNDFSLDSCCIVNKRTIKHTRLPQQEKRNKTTVAPLQDFFCLLRLSCCLSTLQTCFGRVS